MTNDRCNPRTMLEVEQHLLRRYGWVFLAGGLPLGCLVDGALWAAVTLDRALLPSSWSEWITFKGLLSGVVLGAIPFMWRLGLWIERRWGGGLRRWGAAPIGTLLLFAGAEAGLRSGYGQSLLWQAVRVRAGEHYFAREVALFRLDHAQMRNPAPGVVVAGSSQMLHALDAPRLSVLIGAPVYRRAVAGMFPVELCAAAGFLDFNTENKLMLMLSGFDIGARDRIYPDAVRPLATRAGVRLLREAASQALLINHWRFFVDVHVAALSDWWRSRDFVRLILERPFGPRLKSRAAEPAIEGEEQRAAYQMLGRNSTLVDYSLKLLERFFAHMSARFAEIVVVEGQVNPAYPGREVSALHVRAREAATRAVSAGLIRYHPLSAQAPSIGAEDWLDMAHVDDRGRAKYTELFAGALARDAGGAD